MQCLNLLLSWLKCNVIKSHLATLVIIVIMPWLTPELVQFLHPQKNKDISPLFSVIYRNRWPHFLKQFWYFISYTNVFAILYDAFKLKAANNELIWHGWYPPHITVVDNTGGPWGTSSTIKGIDGVSTSSLYIFLWSYFLFFDFKLAKKLEKQAKHRYFDITVNFEYWLNNFTGYL